MDGPVEAKHEPARTSIRKPFAQDRVPPTFHLSASLGEFSTAGCSASRRDETTCEIAEQVRFDRNESLHGFPRIQLLR